MKLDALRKKFPKADTVAGRVVALHKGVHVDLGQYVGDGVVMPSPAAEKLMAEDGPAAKKPEAKKSEAKSEDKPDGGKSSDGVDVSGFE